MSCDYCNAPVVGRVCSGCGYDFTGIYPDLTRAQAAGLACMYCGADTPAMAPVGRVAGVQVFACADDCEPGPMTSDAKPGWVADPRPATRKPLKAAPVRARTPTAAPRAPGGLRLAGYVRVSTDRQAEVGYGLPVQRAALASWAADHGHRLIAVHADEGVTGSLAERDGWADVEADLRSKKIDGVVVPRLDRLARDVLVQETFMRAVWELGAEVFSTAPDENNLRDDPDDPTRKLVRRVLGVINEYERDMIVLRMRKGRRAKAKQGGYAYGSPPFGYRSINKTLVPDPDEQRTLRRIRKLATADHSTRAIAADLNATGHLTKRGRPWTSAGVSDVLRKTLTES